MDTILAFAQVTQSTPKWYTVVVPLLTLAIYGILGPAVYLTIVVVGLELAWPGGTKLRPWMQQYRTSDCPTTSRLADDPAFRIECVVAGLIALSTWSVVITAWLAGYLRRLPAPQLTITQYSTRHLVIFAGTLVLGLIGGYSWAQGMRQAGKARTSLSVLSISMSLAGTVLFFYLVEPNLRDILLVLALGTFSGELAAAAQHPTFLSEGLFAELFVSARPSNSPLAGLLGGNKSTPSEEPDSTFGVAASWGEEHTEDEATARQNRGGNTVRLIE